MTTKPNLTTAYTQLEAAHPPTWSLRGVDPDALLPKTCEGAVISYVWGRMPDGLSEPRNFGVSTKGIRTIGEAWHRLEAYVRTLHGDDTETRHYFLEGVDVSEDGRFVVMNWGT